MAISDAYQTGNSRTHTYEYSISTSFGSSGLTFVAQWLSVYVSLTGNAGGYSILIAFGDGGIHNTLYTYVSTSALGGPGTGGTISVSVDVADVEWPLLSTGTTLNDGQFAASYGRYEKIISATATWDLWGVSGSNTYTPGSDLYLCYPGSLGVGGPGAGGFNFNNDTTTGPAPYGTANMWAYESLYTFSDYDFTSPVYSYPATSLPNIEGVSADLGSSISVSITSSIPLDSDGSGVTLSGADGTVSCSPSGVSSSSTSSGGTNGFWAFSPSASFSMAGQFNSFDQSYVNSVTMGWANHMNSASTGGYTAAQDPITCSPSYSGSVTDYFYAGYVRDSTGASSTLSPPDRWRYYQHSLAGFPGSPAQNGDDPNDTCPRIFGQYYEAGTIEHAATLDVTAPSITQGSTTNTTLTISDGTFTAVVGSSPPKGSAEILFSVNPDLECYRYLTLTAESTVNDNQPFTVRLEFTYDPPFNTPGWKQWLCSTGTAGTPTTVTIDLMNPDTASYTMVSVDSTQTRVSNVGPAINLGNDPGWGVNWIYGISFVALTPGETYTFSGLQQTRKTFAKVNFCPALPPGSGSLFPAQQTNGSSITNGTFEAGRPAFWGNVDWRTALDLPDNTLSTFSGSYLTVSAWLSNLASLSSAYTVTTGSGLAGNIYSNSSMPSYWLFGGCGGYWDGSSFHSSCNLDATTACHIYAQSAWDSVSVPPGYANIGYTSPYGWSGISYGFLKTIRGGATVVGYDVEGGDIPWDGGSATSVLTSTSANSGGGTTDSQGGCDTGTPWGQTSDQPVGGTAWTYFTVTANGLDSPLLPTGQFYWFTRLRKRIVFRLRNVSKPSGLDVSKHFTHVRTSEYYGAGTMVISTASNLTPQSWNDTDTGIRVVWSRPRFLDLGNDTPIQVMYGDGSNIYWARTYDGGQTFTETDSMGAGTFGDYDESSTGVKWDFKVVENMSHAYDIWGRLRDNQLNVMRDWTITNLTTVDNGPIAVRESIGTDGAMRIGVFYSVGGVISVKYATDGLTFS